MTDKLRIKIAAAVTALFLAGISVAGIAARPNGTPAPAAAATAPAAVTTAAPQAHGSDDDGHEWPGQEHEIND